MPFYFNYTILMLIVLLKMNAMKSLPLLKNIDQFQIDSLKNTLQTLALEDSMKIVINEKIFEQNDLIVSAIEYPLKNSEDAFKNLDKRIVYMTNDNNKINLTVFSSGISSSFDKYQQSDIIVNFKSDTIFLNQIYKISICCDHTNVVGYTLNLNAKRNQGFILTQKSKFTEIFYIENEKNIKIKSNMITMPFFRLHNENKNKDESSVTIINPTKSDDIVNESSGDEFSYYLNSLTIR